MWQGRRNSLLSILGACDLLIHAGRGKEVPESLRPDWKGTSTYLEMVERPDIQERRSRKVKLPYPTMILAVGRQRIWNDFYVETLGDYGKERY